MAAGREARGHNFEILCGKWIRQVSTHDLVIGGASSSAASPSIAPRSAAAEPLVARRSLLDSSALIMRCGSTRKPRCDSEGRSVDSPLSCRLLLGNASWCHIRVVARDERAQGRLADRLRGHGGAVVGRHGVVVAVQQGRGNQVVGRARLHAMGMFHNTRYAGARVRRGRAVGVRVDPRENSTRSIHFRDLCAELLVPTKRTAAKK